jgi:uncharacterized protein involved in exopolysaccharide biosynthesis
MASIDRQSDWEAPEAIAAVRPLPPNGLFDLAGTARKFARESPRLLATTLLGAVLAAGVWSAWPTKYTATALIMVDPRTVRAVSSDEVLPGIGGDGMAIASIVEVAVSDGALIPLVAAQRLGEVPDLAARPWFGATAPTGDADVAAALRRGLKVMRRGLTYVIEVSMSGREPATVARLANLVADDIVRRQSATRTDASAGMSEAIAGRLADLRAAALASEKAVADYRQAHGLLDGGRDPSVGQRRLTAQTQQAAAARARLEEARARWEELKRAAPEARVEIGASRSEVLSALRTRATDEARQIAELERTFGPRHPRVEAARRRVTVLDEQISTETSRLVDQAKAEVDQLTRQTGALDADIARLTRDEMSSDRAEVGLRDLIGRADSDRQIYEQFLARQKSAREQSGLTQPETRVVSAAQPPLRPDRPNVVATIAVGGLLGLLAGIGWVSARLRRREVPRPVGVAAATVPAPLDGGRDRSTATVLPAEAGRAAIGAAASVVMPSFERETAATAAVAARHGAPLRRPLAGGAAGLVSVEEIFRQTGVPVVADVPAIATPAVAAAPDTVDLEVVDARPALGRFAETFLPHLGDRPGAAMIVTEVPGAVGRTTVGLAVARIAEEAGFSAVLVTAHGRASTLSPSLADLLDGRALADPPPETVGRVSVIGLDGGRGADLRDLVTDRGFAEALDELRRAWDLVVIECPAPVTVAASLAVASLGGVAGVLLVADPEVNGLGRIQDFARLWQRDDERLVMVVLNRAGPI